MVKQIESATVTSETISFEEAKQAGLKGKTDITTKDHKWK
jgi:hypothetical protein